MYSALVTGGARRVGATIVRALAAAGWHTVIHCNRSRKAAQSLLEEVQASGGHGSVVQCDLRDPGAVDGLVPSLEGRAPPLRALINNASQFEFDTLDTMQTALWDSHLAVNLHAPILLSRGFARQVREGATGCIVNILDNKVVAPNPDYFSYSVGKMGLHAAIPMLALALAPRVRVCGIAPGITLPSGGQDEAAFREAHKISPTGTGSTPEQVAGAVRFILETPAYNGSTLVLDGGQALQKLPRDVAFLGKGG